MLSIEDAPALRREKHEKAPAFSETDHKKPAFHSNQGDERKFSNWLYKTFQTASLVFVVFQIILIGISVVYFARTGDPAQLRDSFGRFEDSSMFSMLVAITGFAAPALAVYIGLYFIPGKKFRYAAMGIFSWMIAYKFVVDVQLAAGMVSSLFYTTLFVLVLSLFFKGRHLWRTSLYIAPILFFFCSAPELAVLRGYFDSANWPLFLGALNATVGDVIIGVCVSYGLSFGPFRPKQRLSGSRQSIQLN